MDDTDRTASLEVGGATYRLPVMSPTAGPDVVDIRTLYADSGLFTYDPGFTATASCDSAITFIDGERGQLQYRGYPIEDLAAHSHFLEVCYLLLWQFAWALN